MGNALSHPDDPMIYSYTVCNDIVGLSFIIIVTYGLIGYILFIETLTGIVNIMLSVLQYTKSNPMNQHTLIATLRDHHPPAVTTIPHIGL